MQKDATSRGQGCDEKAIKQGLTSTFGAAEVIALMGEMKPLLSLSASLHALHLTASAEDKDKDKDKECNGKTVSLSLTQVIAGISRFFLPDIVDDLSTGPRRNAYVLQNKNYYSIREEEEPLPLRSTTAHNRSGLPPSKGHSRVDTGYYRTTLERLKDDEDKEIARKLCLILGKEGIMMYMHNMYNMHMYVHPFPI
jgi:hypothetical protein